MKKRILAVLLTLVMLIGMLPVSVFAANMGWDWTVTVIGDNYYKADGTKSSTNKYTANRSLDNSKEHEIGYCFKWNASAGGSTYDGGWQLYVTVDGTESATSAYIYTRDMSTASDSWTTPKSSHTGTSTHPFTIYLSSYPKADYSKEKSYTLTYDANGGTGAPAAETKKSTTGSAEFTISSTVPTNGDKEFLGWADSAAAAAKYQPNGQITLTGNKTIYAVWKDHTHVDGDGDGRCDTDGTCMHDKDDGGYCTVPGCEHPHEGDNACCPLKPEVPTAPDAPTADDLKKAGGSVDVKCINPTTGTNNCTKSSYGVIAAVVTNNYKLEKVTDTKYAVTLNADVFANGYTGNRGPNGEKVAHDRFSAETLNWTATYEDGKWTLAPNEEGVDDTVYVTHAPQKWQEVNKISHDRDGNSTGVKATCTTGNHGPITYGLGAAFVDYENNVDNVKYLGDGKYLAQFHVDPFVKSIADGCNKELAKSGLDARAHQLTSDAEELQWYLAVEQDKETGEFVWYAAPYQDEDASITVSHELVVTFDPANGEDTFTENVADGETVAEPDAPEKDGYRFLGWYTSDNTAFSFDTPITADITLTAKWKSLASNIHIQIYQSDDLSKAILDTRYTGPELVDEVVDLTKLDAHELLKAAGKDFTFEIDGGWYDDGRFNSFKAGKNPAALTALTVTGSWQNLKLIVTPTYPVLYFASAEALKDYQADHSKTDGLLLSTMARKGAALPTEDAPTATRTGYNFTFWSREGQTSDVTGQTVNGWTNLVANWEKKTYTVVAKMELDGAPAYYQNTDYYTFTVSGEYGDEIDFAAIAAQAVAQAKELRKASASYTAEFHEDYAPNAVCTTYGEHQPDQSTHYLFVNVKTEQKVRVFASYEGVIGTDNLLYDGKAPYGANLVEFLNANVPSLDKAGYAHDEWFKKDASEWKFSETDTVSGWTNVLVKYTIVPHSIYAFARLNSAFCPLTTAEFGESVKLNDATLSRLGLGGYNANGYISIGTLADYRNLPLTEEMYLAYYDDEEFLDVVNELKNKVAFETGVSAETAEKIVWTVLFKADESDYMTAPGYPTADENGYQLSGNLFLAAAMFQANGKDVTNMPAVNYTYDDVFEIHDFYLPGETITMPADPTRAGYDFLGWSVTVVPGDADEAEVSALAAADNSGDLLKSGDTYTVTDGGAIFTAQWAARTDTPYKIEYYTENLDGTWALTETYNGEGTTDETIDAAKIVSKSFDDFTLDLTVPETVQTGVVTADGSLVLKLFYTRNTYSYEVRHVKQLSDGSYDTANAEVETFSAKFGATATVTAKDYGPHYPTNDAADKQNIKVSKDLVIEVRYDLDQHTLTFDVNGGSAVSPETVTVLHGAPVTEGPLLPPTKTGYNFTGWYADAEAKTAYDFTQGLTEDKTVYAGWTAANPVTVTHRLTINYVFTDGTTAAESKILDLLEGESYQVISPSIGGYLVDTSVVYGTMPDHDVTVTVTYTRPTSPVDPNPTVVKNPLKFNTTDHFAYVNGYPDGTVRPEGNVTRAEVAAILYRIMDASCVEKFGTTVCSYKDVAPGDWFNVYVATLENAGVIVDTAAGGSFRPNEAITRAELAAMLAQFAATGSSSAAKFNDVSTAHWASKEIAIAANMGWINGYPDGSFRPDQTITRAEMMAMVNRALSRAPKTLTDLLPDMKVWSDNADTGAWYYLDVQEATNGHTYTRSGSYETWKALTDSARF